MKTCNDVDVIIKGRMESLESYRLIIGYKGFGAVGVIAAQHIAKETGAEHRAVLVPGTDTYYVYREDDEIRHPYEFYVDSKNRLAVLVGREIPENNIRGFVKTVTRLAYKNKMYPLYMVGGLDSRFKTDDNSGGRWLANKHYTKKYRTPEEPPLEEGLMVIGPLALHFAYAEEYKLPAIAILPYTRTEAPDPHAASIAIMKLNGLLGTNIGTDKLIREAEIIEKELERIRGALDSRGKGKTREPYM